MGKPDQVSDYTHYGRVTPILRYRDRLYRKYVSDSMLSSEAGVAPKYSTRDPYLHKIVACHFPEDKSTNIVDLGCGGGALVRVAQNEGYNNIIGIDWSPEQVALAKRHSINNVFESDIVKALIDCESDCYDVVVALDVLEHFTKDESLDLADQVYRVLKPGGSWIIHVPNAESPFFGVVRYGDFTHEQAFTSRSITQFLNVIGFTDTACYEDKPIPHGLKSFVRRVIWENLRFLMRLYVAAETGSLRDSLILSQNLLVCTKKPVTSSSSR